MQWHLFGKLSSTGLIFLLISCAGPAPSLPPDYGSVTGQERMRDPNFTKAELKLSCNDIRKEQIAIRARFKELDASIAAAHQRNESLGRGASIFPPLWLAADTSDAERAERGELMSRWDRLLLLGRYHKCPAF